MGSVLLDAKLEALWICSVHFVPKPRILTHCFQTMYVLSLSFELEEGMNQIERESYAKKKEEVSQKLPDLLELSEVCNGITYCEPC